VTLRPSLAPEWQEYVTVLREDAHQLLAWGYADVRVKLSAAQDEYEITGLLADGIDARINSLSTPFHFTLYAIHNERPITRGGRLGKKRPRIDIQIERCGIRPKRFFTFEAKRLRNDAVCDVARSMRDYLGTDGIGRYLTGYYASDDDEAAMIGCVQALNCNFWLEEIRNAFGKDAANGGVLYGVLKAPAVAGVIAEFPEEQVSNHKRSSGLPIQIFHLLLDCQ
jgi:hypothetical protein